MKLAFIVQRYGADILGGSEYHCRLIAERLAERHEIDVITTCATDYITWRNEYPEGVDRLRGVNVRRFPTVRERNIEAFNRYSDWIFHYPHTREDELSWLEQQGPWSPALLEYLERHHRTYDGLIFFTYLYAPTVLGLGICPARSLLVPTAHDEPAIHLDIYKDVFRLPAGIAYNTEVERAFIRGTFEVNAVAEETVGCGVDVARELRYPRASGGTDVGAETVGGHAYPAHVTERGSVFRRRHRLYGPIVLYGGRIDPGKGCEELIEYFGTYARGGGETTLVLMGTKLMPIPEEPFIRFAGLLSEQERLHALEAATIVAVPSPFESLSLLALEAFAVGTPVLANARSEVLVAHCRQSNAGLYYANRDEFVECLKVLTADARLRAAMGRNGSEYVERHYRWDVILSKYDRLLSKLKSAA